MNQHFDAANFKLSSFRTIIVAFVKANFGFPDSKVGQVTAIAKLGSIFDYILLRVPLGSIPFKGGLNFILMDYYH